MIIRGLPSNELSKQPSLMIANTEINCGNFKTLKGTAFSVSEIAGTEHHIDTKSVFGFYADLIAGINTYKFEDNVLLLSWDVEEVSSRVGRAGYLVYPNGKFAYEEYFAAMFNKIGGNWWLMEGECTFKGEFPFTLEDKR